MSKYHRLTNNDSTATLTDDENFAIFCTDGDNDHHHHDCNHRRATDSCSHQCAGDHLHDDYHVEDLIQYNDTVIKRNANNTNNNATGNVSFMGNNGISNKQRRTNGGSSNNLLITTTMDVDDNTMEIPLLQHSLSNGSNKNKSGGYNNNNTEDDFGYGCLCQQKGFETNLNNNSTKTAKSKILWAIGMCCIFMIVEFLGGYIAGSLAIMTDAAHLASDCISFVIGLVAIWLGNRPPDAKMSFGYKRLEVIGAIVSILGIWILTATLVLVAIQRVYANDYDLNANTMMVISGIGILINIIMVFILHTSSDELPKGGIAAAHGHSHSHSHNHSHSQSHNHSHNHHSSPSHHSPRLQRHRSSADNRHLHSQISVGSAVTSNVASEAVVDTTQATSIELSSASLVLNGNGLEHHKDGVDKNLNLRAAMIHAIGDLVQSSGVFLASVLIKIFPKAVILDPLCTLLFSVIVIMTTISLFKESMHIIMDSVPSGISSDDLEMDLLSIEGVKDIHHLNVWSHTSDHSILMVHLVIDFLADSNAVLMKATQLTNNHKYNIKHSTIQIERLTS